MVRDSTRDGRFTDAPRLLIPLFGAQPAGEGQWEKLFGKARPAARCSTGMIWIEALKLAGRD
jgi:hypothetical protein